MGNPSQINSFFKMINGPVLLLVILILIQLSGCKNKTEFFYQPEFSTTPPPGVKPVYIFGVHPLHNPQRLKEVFGPLVDYLNENIDEVQFKLEASRNYAAYDNKLYQNKFHFALPNPYQTINAVDRGYKVFGKMADDINFKGIILVRKDSNIMTIADLKGKAVSYPAPTALAATMMPQFYIQNHGLDVMTELENRYVGSQESSIMNVYLKNTAAGATWPPPWKALSQERPELERELKIMWETPSLPNNGLVVLPEVQQKLVDRVSELLFELHHHPPGINILAQMHLSHFEPANEKTYQPVREFIQDFSTQVRPLDE